MFGPLSSAAGGPSTGLGGTPPPQTPGTPPAPPATPVPQTQQPDLSGVQIPEQPVPTVPVTPALARNAQTGLGWHALMGTHGEIGPGGTVTQQQNTPGQLFRSILAGAIMGAANSYPKQGEAGGFSPAFARGLGAEEQGRKQQDQQLQQQSQQQLENQMAQRREQREQTMMNAQIAQMHAQQIALQHSNDIMDKRFHDERNAAAQTMINTMREAGGVAPVDGAVPENITAPELVQAYSKNPNIRKAPDGYVRHFYDKTDASELTWDDKAGHWVTADGDPANMTNNSVVTVMDVPINSMTTKKMTSGADINKAAGQTLVDPDKQYPMAPVDMINLYNQNLKNQQEQARTRVAERQASASERANQLEADRQRHAQFEAQRTAIASKKESLQNQLKDLNADLSATPEQKKAVTDQIAEQDQALQDLADEEYPRTKKPGTTTTQKTQTQTQTYIDPTQIDAGTGKPGKVFNLPPDQVEAFKKAHPNAFQQKETPKEDLTSGPPTERVVVLLPDGTSRLTMTRQQYAQRLKDMPEEAGAIIAKAPEPWAPLKTAATAAKIAASTF